jgi:enediyne biosynthesis protein E4
MQRFLRNLLWRGAFPLLAFTISAADLPFTLFPGAGQRHPLPAAMPGGIAIFDADNDGLLDLYFPNGAPRPAAREAAPAHSNRFLHNDGQLRFSDQSSAAGLAGQGYDLAATAGDYDQDGFTDLLVSGLSGLTLYRNQGNGKFTDVTAAAGLSQHQRWSVGAAWLDYDRDGHLDLFVVNYVQWNAATERTCVVEGRPDFCHPRFYAPQPNTLYRNNGHGVFTDVSQASGIAAHPGKGMAAAVADFNADGFPDIFVSNDRVFNFLFLNTGKGTFTESAFDLGVAAPASGNPPSAMGVAAADYDNDGLPDLIYTALRDETFPLYRNLGPSFEDAAVPSRLGVLTRPMNGWGIVFADLDNDGWKDLAVARGDVLAAKGSRGPSVNEPLSTLRNLGDGRFAGPVDLPTPKAQYRGLLAADLDNDGCLDLVATALSQPARLIPGRCPPANHWIQVKVSTPGTRIQIGSQHQFVSPTQSYAASCACPLHFGLGPRREPVTIRLTTPTGQVREWKSIPVNQTFEPPK